MLGHTAQRTHRPAEGDRISAELPDELPVRVEAEEIALDVVYEDSDLAVIAKPAGIAVHPGAGRPSGTIANALVARWPDSASVGDPARPGIVHRLDVETSGLMAVALSPAGYEGLSREIKGRRVEREYRALVRGRLVPSSGLIDAPIGRDQARRKKMSIAEGGRAARTSFETLAEWESQCALLGLRLETGRTHQIRVHLASIGHPVIGDSSYGSGGVPAAPRTFLHSARLAFRHPVTGIEIALQQPLPADLQRVLDTLGPPSTGTVV